MKPEDKAVWEKVVELLEDNREYIEANERPEYLALYDKGIADANALLEQPEPEPEPVQEPKSSERVQWIFENRAGEKYTLKTERYTKQEAEISARLLGHKSIGPAWLNQDTPPAQPAVPMTVAQKGAIHAATASMRFYEAVEFAIRKTEAHHGITAAPEKGKP